MMINRETYRRTNLLMSKGKPIFYKTVLGVTIATRIVAYLTAFTSFYSVKLGIIGPGLDCITPSTTLPSNYANQSRRTP